MLINFINSGLRLTIKNVCTDAIYSGIPLLVLRVPGVVLFGAAGPTDLFGYKCLEHLLNI